MKKELDMLKELRAMWEDAGKRIDPSLSAKIVVE